MFYKLSCSMVVSTTLAVLLTTTNLAAHASVTPDRTRLVFNESDKSISVTLRNNNEKLPYLAQSWLEDEKGNKITSPLAVLPPVQRIDAMMNGQVKIQALPDIHTLPSDRESLSTTMCVRSRQSPGKPTPCKLRCKPASNCSGDQRRWRRLI